MSANKSSDDVAEPASGAGKDSVSVPSFRLNNFDLLRIFAALQVLIFHTMIRMSLTAPAWLQPLNQFPGVPIFFTISGFLVSASYERQAAHPGKYFKNRFVRIYPGLWVCILATVVTVLALGFRPVHLSDFLWLPAQLVGLVYTPGFLHSFGIGSYNGSLWTIPIELQFYVVVPFAYALVKLSRIGNAAWIFLLCLFAGAFVVLAFKLPGIVGISPVTTPIHTGLKWVGFTFIPHIYLFFWGVVLQRYKVFRSKLIAGKGLFWLVAYIAVTNIVPYSPLIYASVMMLLGLSSISLAYTLPGVGERILHGQDVSYGLYIYHGLWINILIQMGKRGTWSGFWIVLVAACISAILSWKLIEQPFLRTKTSQARPAASTTPAQCEAVVHE